MSGSLLDTEAHTWAHATPHDIPLTSDPPIAPVPTSALSDLHISSIKTQKAQGIKALSSKNIAPGLTGYSAYSMCLLPQNTKPEIHSHHILFARPCPITPRHGFVESRPILNMDEGWHLLDEARAIDPEAEVIVMPRLSGKWSGIATNAGVTWGHGNDGVTSGGNGAVVFIPAPSSVSAWNLGSASKLNSTFRDAFKGTAYIEIVEDEGFARAVQYRAGPAQPTTVDFIPRKMVVKKVLFAEGDLLKWEKTLSELTPEERKGTAINAYSLALSSHYAVHGIALDIPVITSRPTRLVGDILEPQGNALPKLHAQDYKNLAKGIQHRLLVDYKRQHEYSQQEVLATAVATMHAMSHWDNSPLFMDMRALAVVAVLRYLCSAVVGEVRHFDRKGPGNRVFGAERRTVLPRNKDEYDDSIDRDSIYAILLKPLPLSDMLSYFQTTQFDFFREGWGADMEFHVDTQTYGPRWSKGSTSYGGPNWGRVSRAGERLAIAVEAFLVTPNKMTWQAVFMALNNAVHIAHNNGRALDKWIGDSMLTCIANAPALGFTNSFAAELALGLLEEGSK